MITFTGAAEKAITERLAQLPKNTRVRISTYGIGCQCKPQHPEGRASFSQEYHQEDDELFEINGIPCAMAKTEYGCGCLNLRIGIAGITE